MGKDPGSPSENGFRKNLHPRKLAWKYMEPENHPLEIQNHLPNLHFLVAC